jgi:hypothetical protein
LHRRAGFAILAAFNDKESDMKEAHRQRIERHLEEFAAWRASGQALKTYVQQRGEDLTVWRARLTWERRWQQMLAGSYQKPAPQGRAAFVQAVARQGHAQAQARHPQNPNLAPDNVCIVVSAPGCPGLQASIHWPIDQLARSSAWLREVLA